jgi:hypothetical protein
VTKAPPGVALGSSARHAGDGVRLRRRLREPRRAAVRADERHRRLEAGATAVREDDPHHLGRQGLVRARPLDVAPRGGVEHPPVQRGREVVRGAYRAAHPERDGAEQHLVDAEQHVERAGPEP